ncbi:helix-turn-helix domain-containing protein [Paenibacillus filicis]|uniref:helix-turn-helix domain-containing protein n=1 Tax=Paenibacillus filicis TaxID=669464 RepID=UPI003BFA3877
MTPAEFARRMEVAPSTVYRWINNERNMTYEHTVLASRILNCHAEDFYEVTFISKRKRR